MKQARYAYDRIQSIESLRHPLGMSPSDLLRLAERASKLYFVAKKLPKDDGTVRELYDTREPLKTVLQAINKNFLRRVQYPEYLTGGIKKKDYVDSVEAHAKARTVIKEDISKFYPSVTIEVVAGIWTGFFGFAPDVGQLLAALTTRDGHLEQGAPTSGYLANLALWDIEPGLVRRLEAMGVERYTRHVDDITMSSLQHLGPALVRRAAQLVKGALAEKGLIMHPTKHKVTHSHQPLEILKLLGNARPALPAKERSRVRRMVYQFQHDVEAGVVSRVDLLAQVPKMQGQAYKVKRFHKHEGDRLAAQVKVAEIVLRDDLDGG